MGPCSPLRTPSVLSRDLRPTEWAYQEDQGSSKGHHMPDLIPYPYLQRGRSERRTYTLHATRGILYKRSCLPTYGIPATLVRSFSWAHICLVGTTGVRVLRERGGSFVAFISLAF